LAQALGTSTSNAPYKEIVCLAPLAGVSAWPDFTALVLGTLEIDIREARM
jgi:hypothetical protein